MALVKYPEALPTNRHFRLSLTLTVGFWSHQYMFRTLHPDPSGIPQLFVGTSLFLKSLGNLYLDTTVMSFDPSKGTWVHALVSRAIFTSINDLLVEVSTRCEDG